uniref:Predicted protein n=1 Tax=Hordeum vulgare subsp. vulgare TaxID=112509 RepID=F2DTS1_HORVV|nr:predicted protein [Hordeum vulgare subsp. vulgare]
MFLLEEFCILKYLVFSYLLYYDYTRNYFKNIFPKPKDLPIYLSFCCINKSKNRVVMKT